MQYDALLSNAATYAGRLVVLAVVPLAGSFARWSDVVALATRPGHEVGIKLALPHPIADLWTFVDAPDPASSGLHVDAPMSTADGLSAAILVGALAYVVGTGLLMAGYVGSVDQFVRHGRYDFLENVWRYGVRMVGVQVVVYAYLLCVVAAGFLEPLLVVVGILVGLLAWIFLYLAPFLVVVDDRPLPEAFARSFELVGSRREPVVFLAIYAGIVLLGSLPTSLATNAGLPGVLAAALFASLLGNFLTVFTVLFVRELVAPARPPAGSASDASGATGPGLATGPD